MTLNQIDTLKAEASAACAAFCNPRRYAGPAAEAEIKAAQADRDTLLAELPNMADDAVADWRSRVAERFTIQ